MLSVIAAYNPMDLFHYNFFQIYHLSIKSINRIFYYKFLLKILIYWLFSFYIIASGIPVFIRNVPTNHSLVQIVYTFFQYVWYLKKQTKL